MIPSRDYPKGYPLSSLLTAWNPHNISIPSKHFNSLCSFNYQDTTELAIARKYRDHEVPFVLRNHPDLNDAVTRWRNFDYLEGLFGGADALYRSEYSNNNHFMYWQHTGPAAIGAGIGNLRGSGGEGDNQEEGKEEQEEEEVKWINPTEKIYLTFREWLQFAVENDRISSSPPLTANSSSVTMAAGAGAAGYKYFRVSGYDNDTSPLFSELPFFQNKQSFFIVSPQDQEGIHCRFCESPSPSPSSSHPPAAV
jgi:hypothetical protein